MKSRFLAIATAILFISTSISGQTYQSLWKAVEEAQEKDLPQTAMTHLKKIEQKASKEIAATPTVTTNAYGQWLKAVLLHAKLQAEVAPDSLVPAVQRLEQREQVTKELALKAVYDVALASICESLQSFDEKWKVKSDTYHRQAMEHPEVLAKTKCDGYTPFVIKEKDSELFGHDLLSIVGMELNEWQWLNRYYDQVGNRPAACLTGLHTVHTIESVDSLIHIYSDLPEAGELAIKRYELMRDDRFTAAQKDQWLEQSLQRWGGWKRANELRNERRALNNPCYQVNIATSVQEVNKPQMIHLTNLRNIERLTMHVYRTTLKGDTELDINNKNDLRQIEKTATLLEEHTRTLTFTGHASYEIFQDSLLLDGLPAGVYVLMFRTQQETQIKRMLYFVSGVRVIIQAQPHDKKRYVVVDATTGQPLKDAQLRHSSNRVFAFTPTDEFCPEVNDYGSYNFHERQYNSEHANLFTDRSIYRPGQTVHASAIVWKELSATDIQAVEGKHITFTLRDANWKVVAEQQATTDRYGKCGVTFTLPTGKLNGHFSIQTANGSASIRVEEYKRPTFQVEFADYKQSYQNGDTIAVEGKAMTYAGVPVQEGKVKYTVKRRIALWWMSYSRYWNGGAIGRGLQEVVMSEGEAVTKDDGTFSINMPMVLPRDLGSHSMFYHFVVEADVTDQAGETHHGTMTLPLGNKVTVLTCNLPEQVRSDQMPELIFSRLNAAGKEIAGTVRYRIDDGKWKECAANIHHPSPNTPRNATLSKREHLSSGQHRLEAICGQDTLRTTFVVFSLNDKKPATKTHDWFYVSDTQFPNDGKPVTVQVGSSDPNLYIVYGIYAGDKEIESGAVEKDAALINRHFTYQEEYGNGLLLTFAWVKDGQCYRHQTFIRRPMPDKQLKLQWQTFRNRLTPGQQEEWLLTIQKPDGAAPDASLMAVLYDKSLDALQPHQWSFTPNIYLPRPYTYWKWQGWSGSQLHGSQHFKLLDVPYFSYSTFDRSVFPSYIYYSSRRNRVMIRGAKPAAARSEVMMMKQAAIGAMDVSGNEDAADAREEAVTVGYGGSQQQQEPATEQVQVRENLQETAFCYPTLTTAADGTVALRFTLPESLTTWRFMGIANTTDMFYGTIDGEAVAQKDVMIQPNIPRFVRMGDETQISARIFNTSDRNISGTARLQLLDPATEVVVFEQQQPFTVAAQQTDAATFVLSDTQFNTSLLICKVTAEGEGFSDGEQHYLPILPNREYVTKTISYSQNEPGVKSIDLTPLFPQGTTQQKLTIEYTNNPAWLIVQSLPVIGQPCEHSAIDLAASYYSNRLAQTLIAQSPQVKGVFEQWKRTDSHRSPLTSHLSQNEELKDLLLAETPWGAAADREDEQRQHLADFFDENALNHRLEMTVAQLQKLQHANGSFSWYPGMEGCTDITVAIGEMLARLNVLTASPSRPAVVNGSPIDISTLYEKATNYIDQQMVKLVEKMKQEEKKGHRQHFPSFTALRWLYICAIDNRQLSASVKSANNYLVSLLKKDIKQQSIYEKAMTAVILAQRGEKAKAAEYVKSIREYSVYTEEMGRYFDTPRAYYSWYDYKIPTEVAALEAIQWVTPNDQQTVDEMRRWLLQEKRTQTWDTPINSTNAIYAFLQGNSTALTTTQPATVLAIDGSPIATATPTAGIGYVKTVSGATSAKTFTATKTSEGTSWGAVYAQFLQKTAEVEASQSGITIQREVLPLTSLKVGDRIKIRITIDAARDLDFVQVVDRRASCMEPVQQLSGYRNGAYIVPKDAATHYFFGMMSKGRHVIETEYYIDRAGNYDTGTCTVGCAYAAEYRATAPSIRLSISK